MASTVTLSKLWLAVGSIALMVVSTLIGAISSDYLDFRSEYRSEFRSEYKQMAEAERNLLAYVQSFSSQATGNATVSAEKRNQFVREVTVLYQDAKDVADRVPEVKKEFYDFGQALVELKESALSMSGPIDAKPFWISVDKVIVTRDRFLARIREERRSYF